MRINKVFFSMIFAFSFMGNAWAEYPDKPIKIIVPFAPGGPTDVVARSLANVLGRTMGNAVIVENRPGAGGAVGTALVARAAPDGYTLAIAAVSTHVVSPACNTNVAYDPVKDFTPISLVADVPMIWVMRSNMPEKNFSEVIATARKSPGQLSQGTAGLCTLQHMLVEKINNQLKIKIESVPYQGSAPALNDFLGGNINLLMDVGYLIQPLIASGKAKPIAVVSANRLESLPDTPTVDELGYKDLNIRPWYGVVGPKGLSAEVTKKLIDAVNVAMTDKKLLENFKSSGMLPVTGVNGSHFSDKINKEFRENKAFASQTNTVNK